MRPAGRKGEFMSDTIWLPQIMQDRCTACGDCIQRCPTGALGWRDGKAALINPERCSYEAVCEALCPTSAIEIPYLIEYSSRSNHE